MQFIRTRARWKTIAGALSILLLTGWYAGSAAQRVLSGIVETASTETVKGMKRDGTEANRPYRGGVVPFGLIRVKKLMVRPNAQSTQESDPIRYTITLTNYDIIDHPVTIVIRPILWDDGLGNGYTWTAAVPSGQQGHTFTMRATQPPTGVGELPKLLTGTYLVEAFQPSDPIWIPHQTDTLTIAPPETYEALRTHDPKVSNFLDINSLSGVLLTFRSLMPIYTPITLVEINDANIKQRDYFHCTVTMDDNLANDIDDLVKVKIQIQTTGATPQVVRTYADRSMPPRAAAQTQYTFNDLDAVNDQGQDLPVGIYTLTVRRVHGDDTTVKTATLRIRPKPVIGGGGIR